MQAMFPAMRRPAAAFLVLIATALPAAAQHVSLSMRDGLVTLDARNATIRQILTEWAKVGRVTVVNGEKVTGAPVTLQFAALPERQALDIVLRGVAGYMVGARVAQDASAARFDRVMILATSAAPPPVPAGNPQAAFGAPMRQSMRPPSTDADDDTDDPAPAPEPATPPFQPVGASAPRGVVTGGGAAGAITPPGGAVQRYQVPLGGYPPGMVPPVGAPAGGQARPTTPGQPGPATTPSGAPASGGAPGVVTPVPQQTPLSPTNPGTSPPAGSSQALTTR